MAIRDVCSDGYKSEGKGREKGREDIRAKGGKKE